MNTGHVKPHKRKPVVQGSQGGEEWGVGELSRDSIHWLLQSPLNDLHCAGDEVKVPSRDANCGSVLGNG